MCGIAGWIGTKPDDLGVIDRIKKQLFHRGPNEQTARTWPDAALIHTRLSIIDLSPTGSQPLSNEDGSIWVIFNGEIYNHREVRERLLTKGHRFRGHSDTEIIPHLYEEYGLDFVGLLRGMFAIALWDVRYKRMILVRDRFGIKPMFFSLQHERLAFASEIRALLEMPDIDRTPDEQAVHDFAALFFIPAPLTFYKGIRALAPGEILEAVVKENGHVDYSICQYTNWVIKPDINLSLAEAVEKAEELIDIAVKRQLESEVSLGAFLSGGIDSSLITQAAQKNNPEKVFSYNVKFSDPDYDETWAALAVSQYIGSQHTTLSMMEKTGSWEFVNSILAQAGQPFADTSIFPVSAICEVMSQHITVALSGDGGDEGFGGYESFRWIEKISLLQKLPSFMFLFHPASFLGSRLLSARHLQRFYELSNSDDVGIIENLHSWMRKEELTSLCWNTDLLPVRRWFEPKWKSAFPANSSRIEKLSALTTETRMRLFLPNDYLFKVDIASMRSGMEIRVPMLDEDLIDFGLSLPHKLKVRGNACKRILREIARKRLPQDVAAKPKHGFGIPIDSWVDGNFKLQVKECLFDSNSRLPEFFRPTVYKPLVEAFCDDKTLPEISRAGLFNRIIMLLALNSNLSST